MTALRQRAEAYTGKSWPRLSGQRPAEIKWIPAGLLNAGGGGRDFVAAAGGRSPTRCAWHGHWIGGGSPLRGEMVATASRRQLHAASVVVRHRCWRREAVWGRSPRRTAAPNASEPLCKPNRPGQRVCKRDARTPSEAGAVLGAGAAGHSVNLTQGGLHGPARAVDPKEATTTGRRSCRSRISS